jgi:two-component system, OmpR family, KDP operon response regulator KdpE
VGGRILIVDDEPHIRRILRVTLAAKGYEVMEAESGEDALTTLMHVGKCDLILLDINMPGITGLELCRKVRSRSDLRDVIVVVMSTGEEHRDRALDAGANDYLSKPFGVAQVFSCLESNLSRAARERGAR